MGITLSPHVCPEMTSHDRLDRVLCGKMFGISKLHQLSFICEFCSRFGTISFLFESMSTNTSQLPLSPTVSFSIQWGWDNGSSRCCGRGRIYVSWLTWTFNLFFASELTISQFKSPSSLVIVQGPLHLGFQQWDTPLVLLGCHRHISFASDCNLDDKNANRSAVSWDFIFTSTSLASNLGFRQLMQSKEMW